MNTMLYDKNRTKLICVPGGKKGKFVVPSGVTRIGDDAFSGCSGLTSIVIPNSVTRIGAENNSYENGVFRDCTSLTTITLPNSVTEIGFYAFRGSGITTITLSNKLERIYSLMLKNKEHFLH